MNVPQFEYVSNSPEFYKKIKFVSCDTSSPFIDCEFVNEIKGLPQLYVFYMGRFRGQMPGFMTCKQMTKFLNDIVDTIDRRRKVIKTYQQSLKEGVKSTSSSEDTLTSSSSSSSSSFVPASAMDPFLSPISDAEEGCLPGLGSMTPEMQTAIEKDAFSHQFDMLQQNEARKRQMASALPQLMELEQAVDREELFATE